MKRVGIKPRPDWEKKVEEIGLIYHHTEGRPYWNESAYYLFGAREIDRIESATNELHEMCLKAAQQIIDQKRFKELGIPDAAIPVIKQAWEDEPPALYGRFDLAYDGEQLKLLEYNADTPTGLLEASVAQWYWLQDLFPKLDQFNSIHEKLLAKWQELKPYIAKLVHFAYLQPPDVENSEDLMTVSYLLDIAGQAGFDTTLLKIDDIGWDAERNCFADLDDRPIRSIFKLYPWEWLLRDEYANQLLATYPLTQWIEPIWKMLLSNKGILPILWEMFPGHPNLLESHFSEPKGLNDYVKKPLLSREGANLTIRRAGSVLETSGPYGNEGYIYQKLARIPNFDAGYPVLGSWVIDGVAAGIGIRESATPVTDNYSAFVPHLFE
ncbi:MAG TPA: glutathionylspermidine synthase family protein [Candidatus Binatia bacterium]|nr:glutathionylspermidine synthase family protein [Candidatus Binatia bacterium]